MHKRRLIQFALAGLAGLTIHPLAAAAAGQAADEDLPLLVAGMDAAYPPFGFKDSKTGEFVGFDVDIIRAIGRTAGFSVKVENIPFDGLIPASRPERLTLPLMTLGLLRNAPRALTSRTAITLPAWALSSPKAIRHSKRKRSRRQSGLR